MVNEGEVRHRKSTSKMGFVQQAGLVEECHKCFTENEQPALGTV